MEDSGGMDKEKERLRALCTRYGLGEMHRAEPVRPGTVARVWHVSAEAGEFLVRTLPGEAAGEREWKIFRHLTERDFTAMPAIRLTEDGVPMARIGETWYQVQNFCPGVRPDPAQPGVCRAAAELALALTAALKDCAAVGPEEGQVIHGDLGPWNLLDTPEGLMVLDFGSARMGDPYFDLAALLAGFLNHAAPVDHHRILSEFTAGAGEPDRKRLLEQIRLWAAVNRAKWSASGCGERTEMLRRFQSAVNWAEKYLG